MARAFISRFMRLLVFAALILMLASLAAPALTTDVIEPATAYAKAGEDAESTETITLGTLINRMVDLRWLAYEPEEGETAGQFSSYDRASQIQNGQRVDWFANGDAGNFIREKLINGRVEMVMADIKGPGAITRIWSANPKGILRIYIDGAQDPVIEADMETLLGGFYGYPFTHPFSGIRSKGYNLYFPLPFKERILVTCENPEALYYHVNYLLFPEGTDIEPFSWESVEKYKAEISRAEEILNSPYEKAGIYEDYTDFKETAGDTGNGLIKKNMEITLVPGGSTKIELTGPAAITSLEFKVDPMISDETLRNILFTVNWDNEEKPSVWAPLGDFFGGGPGLNPYEGLPLGVMSDGLLYSKWFMPFKEKAVLTVTNGSEEEVVIESNIESTPIQWDDKLMYFHAWWRQDYPINTRPFKEWEILDADGPGRFVGTALTVVNTDPVWWGEGDEKIYVDREEFPSTFGTGTEDYFGYAWCDPTPFTHSYHNQPRADGPNNYGTAVNNRYHILDNIPFREHIRFDLEIWHHIPKVNVAYATMAYWYGKSGNNSFEPLPKSKTELIRIPPYSVVSVEGAVEGESLPVEKLGGGEVMVQDLWVFGNKWSNAKHLWWLKNKPGDRLSIYIPIEEEGLYRIKAVFTKAPDYGCATLYVNGRQAGDEIDFYDPYVIPTELTDLGEFYLDYDNSLLEIEITGKNGRSTGYLFGIDYLILERVEQ